MAASALLQEKYMHATIKQSQSSLVKAQPLNDYLATLILTLYSSQLSSYYHTKDDWHLKSLGMNVLTN